MKILILGGDGYLGWPTAMHLSQKGHEVGVLDNGFKRHWEAICGVSPLVPVATMFKRADIWKDSTGKRLSVYNTDMTSRKGMYYAIDDFKPDAVVHYAEQPSAPFSMMNASQAIQTQYNNVIGTLNLIHAVAHYDPSCHIVKLGTMGEYGTPNIDIEEGWLNVEHNGRSDRVLFPKRPGSWYHASKVHDSTNLEFACRIWGLRVTDLNQGVVYGVSTPGTSIHEELNTSFHYDAIFGTVINRFIVQSVCGTPLTVYGSGSQKRGFININDTIECIRLACENPPPCGEFRVMNQMTEQFSITELAVMIAQALDYTAIDNIENPRIEQEHHYYNVKHTALTELGLQPHFLTKDVIQEIATYVEANRHLIDGSQILPSVKWRQK